MSTEIRERRSSISSARAPAVVAVRSWPLVDEGLGGFLPLVVAVIVGIVVGAATARPVAGVLASVLLALCAWRAWLPTRFVVGPDGVRHVVLGRERLVPWTAVRRYQLDQRGVFLLPLEEPAPIDFTRALFVPWNGQREALEALLSLHLDGRR